MIRVLNFFCLALMALAVWRSIMCPSRPRGAEMQLATHRKIADRAKADGCAADRMGARLRSRPHPAAGSREARHGDTPPVATCFARTPAASRDATRTFLRHASERCDTHRRSASAKRVPSHRRINRGCAHDPTAHRLSAGLLVTAFALVGVRLVDVMVLKGRVTGATADISDHAARPHAPISSTATASCSRAICPSPISMRAFGVLRTARRRHTIWR